MKYKWAIMFCMMPAMTMVLLDATIVNVALAKFGAVFGVDVATVDWAVTAFSLAMGIATPMASFVEQRFTMKRAWVVEVSLFTIGSLLCGFAPTFWLLIIGRIMQGAGAGAMFPMAIGALFSAFPPGERGAAMGILAIPLVAGPAFGPTIGGYIVTNMDWRMVFFVNLPVGILAIATAALLLHPSQPQKDKRLDVGGALLSMLAFGCSLYGLGRVAQDGWGSAAVQVPLGIGALSLALFCLYEIRCEEPLMDVRLFALPEFFIANALGWVSTVALFGAEFMLPLYLQNLRGLSAFDAGLILMPQGLAVAFTGPLAGRLLDKIGPRYIVVFGSMLLALNTWEMSQITLQTSFETLRWLLIVRGVALGFTMQPTQLVALAVVPDRLRINASSLNMAMRSVFQSFGVAMLATSVQTQTTVHTTVLGWQVAPGTVPGTVISQLGAILHARDGLTAAAAHLAAIALMTSQIAKLGATLAFADAYRMTFFVALAALVIAFLLPGRGAIKVDSGAMMGE